MEQKRRRIIFYSYHEIANLVAALLEELERTDRQKSSRRIRLLRINSIGEDYNHRAGGLVGGWIEGRR